MLSNDQMYLVSTPFTIYLWLGSNLNIQKQKGAIHILKVFITNQMGESLVQEQSYKNDSHNINQMRIRIEYQYNESSRFMLLFPKVWRQEVQTYLMLNIRTHDQLEKTQGGSNEE